MPISGKLLINSFVVVLLFVTFSSCQSKARVATVSEGTESTEGKRNVPSSKSAGADGEIKTAAEEAKFWLSRAEVTQSLKDALAAAKKDKENPKAYVNIARYSFLLNKVSLGRKACKRSLKLKPGYQPALLACARIEFADENFDLAELTLDKLSKKNQKTAPVLELRALIALKRDELNEAANLYFEAAQLNRKNLKLQLNAGLIFLKYRQIERAEEQFSMVLKQDDDNAIAQFHLAVILASKNKWKEAEELFNEARDDDLLAPMAQYHLAILYEGQGRFSEAQKMLTSINRKSLDKEFEAKLSQVSFRINSLRRMKVANEAKLKNRKLYIAYLKKKEEAEKAAAKAAKAAKSKSKAKAKESKK